MYAGIDHNIPGNGGPECSNYLSTRQRVFETILAVILAIFELKWSIPRLSFPNSPSSRVVDFPTLERLRRWLVAFLCFVFGVEMGYKLASRTSLYALNPCHIATIVQIALLCSNQTSRFSIALFRVHLYLLSGATLALLFPVVNTRLFPLEVTTYYVQHAGILILPIMFMALGGSFVAEPLEDFSWAVFYSGIFFIYHFLPLQLIGLATQANLDNILCPAISDPFKGRWYRLAAIFHQSVYIPLHGKLYAIVATRLSHYIRRRLLRMSCPGDVNVNVNVNVAVKNGSTNQRSS